MLAPDCIVGIIIEALQILHVQDLYWKGKISCDSEITEDNEIVSTRGCHKDVCLLKSGINLLLSGK